MGSFEEENQLGASGLLLGEAGAWGRQAPSCQDHIQMVDGLNSSLTNTNGPI